MSINTNGKKRFTLNAAQNGIEVRVGSWASSLPRITLTESDIKEAAVLLCISNAQGSGLESLWKTRGEVERATRKIASLNDQIDSLKIDIETLKTDAESELVIAAAKLHRMKVLGLIYAGIAFCLGVAAVSVPIWLGMIGGSR